MHIAVAFAHETVALARYEIAATSDKRALAPGFEFTGVGLPDRVIDGIEEVLKILLHGLIDSLRCPKVARRFCRRDAGMKRTHRMGQEVDVRHLQLAGLYEMAQQGSLGKLHHFHRILNGSTLAVQTRSLWRARDGDHVEVQLGCQTAIEAEFFLTEEVAFGERGEIDKA